MNSKLYKWLVAIYLSSAGEKLRYCRHSSKWGRKRGNQTDLIFVHRHQLVPCSGMNDWLSACPESRIRKNALWWSRRSGLSISGPCRQDSTLCAPLQNEWKCHVADSKFTSARMERNRDGSATERGKPADSLKAARMSFMAQLFRQQNLNKYLI